MANKLIKIFLCFAICISFAHAQNDVDLDMVELKIEGMHCSFGCAKGIETALNSNEGIEATIEFVDSNTPGKAQIVYATQYYSNNSLIEMINNLHGGKFTASLLTDEVVTNPVVGCSKGKQCCQATGIVNSDCDKKDQGCCAGSQKKCKKKKKKKKKKK